MKNKIMTGLVCLISLTGVILKAGVAYNDKLPADKNKSQTAKAHKTIDNSGINPNDGFADVKRKILKHVKQKMAKYPDLDKLKWKVKFAGFEGSYLKFMVYITDVKGVHYYLQLRYKDDNIYENYNRNYEIVIFGLLSSVSISDKTQRIVVKTVKKAIWDYERQELFLESGHKFPVDNAAYQKWLARKKSPETEKILEQVKSNISKLSIKLRNVSYNTDIYACTGKLKLGKQEIDIEYNINLDNQKQVDIDSGSLKNILCLYPSVRPRKVVPYSEMIRKRATDFEHEYTKKITIPPRGEFELAKDYKIRKAKAEEAQKAKAYANLAKKGGLINIYKSKIFDVAGGTEFSYRVDEKSLHYYGYNNNVSRIIDQYSHPHTVIKIDILGVLTRDMYNTLSIPNFNNVSISQAKIIKKKLGNSWKIKNMALWYKYDYRKRQWYIIKIFILPPDSKQNPPVALDNSSAAIQPETSAHQTKSKQVPIKLVDIKFVHVAPGSFQMGSDKGFADEKPVHEVKISKGFWIGKYEVTQKQYKAVMGTNPSHFKGDNKPVEMVSWNDAVRFCKKLTEYEHKTGRLPADCEYRLPTEAEWEFAARGGIKSKDYEFSGSKDVNEVACCYHKFVNGTEAVGSKKANELGIHDMSGNVYEWCSDWYSKYSSSPAGITKRIAKVVRGGGWCVPAKYCRPAYRYKQAPDSTWKRVGFRIVKAKK